MEQKESIGRTNERIINERATSEWLMKENDGKKEEKKENTNE